MATTRTTTRATWRGKILAPSIKRCIDYIATINSMMRLSTAGDHTRFRQVDHARIAKT